MQNSIRGVNTNKEGRAAKLMQHALKSCNCLHLVDVGAVIDRPRAINNRPYGLVRYP